MKEQTCCFSGHRILPEPLKMHISNILAVRILNLIDRGITTFICGGALGFDTLAALTVLKVRIFYPQIRLILALPSPEQPFGWHKKDIKLYQNILNQANEIVYMAQEYHGGCMHMRNQYMVNHSAYCICYMLKNTGGTAYTVQYAQKQHLHIYNIATE